MAIAVPVTAVVEIRVERCLGLPSSEIARRHDHGVEAPLVDSEDVRRARQRHRKVIRATCGHAVYCQFSQLLVLGYLKFEFRWRLARIACPNQLSLRWRIVNAYVDGEFPGRSDGVGCYGAKLVVAFGVAGRRPREVVRTRVLLGDKLIVKEEPHEDDPIWVVGRDACGEWIASKDVSTLEGRECDM